MTLQRIAIALVCCSFVAMGYAQWPGLHWDAACFAPPVFSAARGDGFAKPAYPVYNVRVPGEQYNYHGFLSVILYGQLLRAKDGHTLLATLGFVNAFTAFLWWRIFGRFFFSHGEAFLRCIPLLAGIAAGSVAVGLQGRPEHPAIAIAALPLLFPRLGLMQKTVSLGLTAGLLFCCSPSSGVLAASGIAVYLGVKPEYSLWWFLKWFFWTGVVAVFFFCCTFVFTPFGPVEWMSAVSDASKHALDFSSHLYRFRNGGLWGASLLLPFWNVVIIFLWSSIFFLLLRRRRLAPACIFAAVSLRFYSVLTDYGYACAYLPLMIFLVSMAERAAKQDPSTAVLKWTCRIVGLWLVTFVGVWFQYMTEAAVYTQLPPIDQRLSAISEGWRADESQTETHAMAAFVSDSPQSYVILGEYFKLFSPFVAVNPDFSSQNWRDDEKKYFEKLGTFPELLLVPSTDTDPPRELVLDGARYRLQSQSQSYGAGVTWYRSRAVGYPFAAYIKQH